MDGNKRRNEPGVLVGQLIEKEFTNKVGKSSGIMELYLRCSIQDYYIKLCESKIEKTELLPYLDKGIRIKGSIKKGDWDNCEGAENEIQSRVGSYIVIEKLM